jgi:hypothetical protein
MGDAAGIRRPRLRSRIPTVAILPLATLKAPVEGGKNRSGRDQPGPPCVQETKLRASILERVAP